ncbi:MAG TPA: hydrolase [Usitatibacter sp.]|jgi:nicotinamidase-related amidase|nr:hydrolase [Usitatibacter sp.]
MQLPAKSTALVLIDLQKGVLAMNVAPHPAAEIHAGSMKLAERFRAAGALVVHVRVSFSAGGVDALKQPVDQPANYGALPADWDVFPQPPAPADLVITKRQWGAFTGTELDLQLRRRGIRSIVLGGISTNIGVESTARNAYELGYELVIAEDLCAGSSAEMHAFSFKNIFPRLSRIATSESIELG